MGINLNGTGGGIVLNGTRDPGLEKAINEEIAARKAADEVLDEKKTDKPTLSSDTESINIDTNSGNKVTVLTDKGVSTLVSGKVDKENGKGLSTYDYTAEAMIEVAKVKNKADKESKYWGFEGGRDASAARMGAALGFTAHTNNGGAVGAYAYTSDGFAGGLNAQAIKGTTPINAIQLGAGTNPNEKTLQIYKHQLLDADGHIPNDRMPTKSDRTTYYNPTTGNAITYDLKNEHNRMTSYINVPTAATSVAISVSNGAYPADYISGLSFYTGSTPPEVSYPSSPYTMRWIGSECTTSGESSVFSPIANRVYDIIFYFNGGYIIGLVNGYDDISQQGA